MPGDDHVFMPSSKMMQADEIQELAKIFVNFGVNKIRLTGGEPLVRKDVGMIIKNLSALQVSLTLTTNGVRLHEFVEVIKESNIRSVNISLDTLNADKFQQITKRNDFKKVWDNIHLLIELGIHVKVNVVAMRGINDTEINNFIAWTKNTPVHVRFIEFMPFTGNKWMSDKVFTWQQILQKVEQHYSFIRLKDEGNDTAKKYMVPGHVGTFAVISTMTAPFCSTCNRMRLTADGKMKNCLFSKDEMDLLGALRNGKDVLSLIQQSIKEKYAERGGQFVSNFELLDSAGIENRSMIAIGG
jgi:cyclic pyranopterin phosphate synthase